MPWKMPPPGVRDRVNRTFGTDMYARLQDVWNATLAGLPGDVPAYRRVEQTRFEPPERVRAEYGSAAEESSHYVGLAMDVGGLTPEAKASIANALYVTQIKTPTMTVPIFVEGVGNTRWKPGAPLPAGHLHWGIGAPELRRVGLVPYIREIVAGLRGASPR